MATKEMKTITIEGEQYEIVDESARNTAAGLQTSISAVGDRATALEARATALEASVEPIEDLQATTTDLDTRIGNLEDGSSGLEARTAAVEDRASAVESRATALEEIDKRAFGKVAIEGMTLQANEPGATLTLLAGDNVTLTPNAADDQVAIAATDTTYNAMSQAEASAGTATTGRLIAANVLKATVVNLIYPVGSIYVSVNSTSPGTLFGGTWERIQDRFLLAAGSTYTAGGTGGAASVTLNSAQSGRPSYSGYTSEVAPTHAHDTGHATYDRFLIGESISRVRIGSSTSGSWYTHAAASQDSLAMRTFTGSDDVVHTHTFSVPAANASQAHNNMPPYLTVYVWKRTA